jgi:hypothetical protein
VIGKTSPIPDDGSGMPQRYTKKASVHPCWVHSSHPVLSSLWVGALAGQ